jgi:hypothetical protein
MVFFYVGNLPIFLDYHLRFVYKKQAFRKWPLGFHETDRHFEGHQTCILGTQVWKVKKIHKSNNSVSYLIFKCNNLHSKGIRGFLY